MAEMEIDVRGQTCPIPLIECRKALKKASPGDLCYCEGNTSGVKKGDSYGLRGNGTQSAGD